MKKYIIFFKDGQEVLGSDGYMPLDGRLGFRRIKELATEIAKRKQPVCSGINGFKIHKGILSDEVKGPLYPIYMQ